jgi:hypothetical protein
MPGFFAVLADRVQAAFGGFEAVEKQPALF